ncbi:MAG TPA: hypothetical protein DCQ37_22830 [Desulfobacteraceae bacterium]|nr:hypothetical protein [Desulfobacteraceae bacterium]
MYFNTCHHIPSERTSEISEHLSGHRISETVIIRAELHNIHPKRGEQGLTDSGILPEFHGIAVHDHRKAYFRYPCGHGLCKSVCEQYCQIRAKNMSGLLTEIHHEVKKTAPYNSRLPPQTVGESESRYDRIIGQGLSVNPPSEKKEGRRGRTEQSVPRNISPL